MNRLSAFLLFLLLAVATSAMAHEDDCCERMEFWTLYKMVDEANFGPTRMEAPPVVQERVYIIREPERRDAPDPLRDREAWRRDFWRDKETP